MSLSPGVVHDYELSMPHFWAPLHSKPRDELSDMQRFSTYLAEPQRHIVGAPQGNEARDRAVLEAKFPTDTNFMIDAQLYEGEQRKKHASKVEQRRLQRVKEGRAQHRAAIVDSFTNAPKLFDRDGRPASLGLEKRRSASCD